MRHRWQAASGRRISRRSHGQGNRRIAEPLLELAGGGPSRIAVSIETPRGSIIETLIERGVAIFSINPKQLDRLRDRHTVAGARDDRHDAFVLADSLRTDMPTLRRVQLGDPRVVEIRELVRLHADISGERIALGNRLGAQLNPVNSYPGVCAQRCVAVDPFGAGDLA